ncbi:DctP family TRAP transporter solute-binding subunit [Pseudomonas sp. LRF_L74]|uniref:DctP family TRAP transporter solute-binding subunit n=1 Tax=Pseudomonas sp. LRF_L74 TaxID=3369422 RepID=UPI003F603543
MLKSAYIVALALFSLNGTAAEPIVISFSHVVADDTPKGQGALLFKKLVEQRLGGQVKVEIHANSSLYGDADELQALLDDKVQMLAPSLAKFSDYTKQLQVFDLPFLFDDLDAVNRFQKRPKGKQLLTSMEKRNITGLAYWHNGMKQLSATRALHAPVDARGLSFRIQASPVLESQFESLGAKAVKIPFAQTLDAMRNGQVQGTENTWSNLLSQNYASVQPYMVESNHGVLDYMLVANSTFWYSIPHSVRTELEGIIDEVTYSVNNAADTQNREARQQLASDAKVHLISLSNEERNAWRQAMRPVWQQYENEIGKDIIEAAQTVNRRR